MQNLEIEQFCISQFPQIWDFCIMPKLGNYAKFENLAILFFSSKFGHSASGPNLETSPNLGRQIWFYFILFFLNWRWFSLGKQMVLNHTQFYGSGFPGENHNSNPKRTLFLHIYILTHLGPFT